MNKIIVKKNKVEIDNHIINNNNIIFNEDKDYVVEYENNTNVNLNITVASNTNINLYIVNLDNNKNINLNYTILQNSNLTINKFYYKDDIFEKVNIDLKGKNSKIIYNFSAISTDNQKYYLKINHFEENTKSIISNRLVTVKNGKIDFRIDSIVEKEKTKCIMDQSTKIITTNEVKSTIKPNMYIDEYDVEAKHSSVVGTIKEEELFYLMSRGISYNEAFKLIIKGYLFSNINKNMFICSYILEIINKYWR